MNLELGIFLILGLILIQQYLLQRSIYKVYRLLKLAKPDLILEKTMAGAFDVFKQYGKNPPADEKLPHNYILFLQAIGKGDAGIRDFSKLHIAPHQVQTMINELVKRDLVSLNPKAGDTIALLTDKGKAVINGNTR